MKRYVLPLFLALAVVVSAAATGAQEESDTGTVTISVLNTWTGSGVINPTDPVNNPVAQAVLEATGVLMETEYSAVPPMEKLTVLFATGDVPDLVNLPFWGGSGGETMIVKKAGAEGQLYPLNDLIDDYPNVRRNMFEGVARDFLENDLEYDGFNGEHYIIPWQTPATAEDITNWAYGVYIRKDIAEELGIDPTTVRHSEELYEIMKDIRDGGFTDIYGNSVIPAGTHSNGWAYGGYHNSYTDPGFSGWRLDDDGVLQSTIMMEGVEDIVLYMQKLVSEGLFDVEAFRQIDSVAREKLYSARYGMVAFHYPFLRDEVNPVVTQENPDMQYIPIGPILAANGEPIGMSSLQLDGRAGSPALVLGANNENPEATLRLLDFVNSREGRLLAFYGIEDVHYEMVNGQPRMLPEWLEKWRTDAQAVRDEGIQSEFTWLIGNDDRLSAWGEQNLGDSQTSDPMYDQVKEMYPIVLADGYRFSFVEDDYPEIEEMRLLNDGVLYRDMIESAFFAETPERALDILNDWRARLVRGGWEDFTEYMQSRADERDDFLF